jgi:hypothetical protein
MIVFEGSCTRCGGGFTWDNLTQQLWCLEAKNEDAFGHCRRGVQIDRHPFDQECDRCEEVDEGVEIGDEFGYEFAQQQQASGSSSSKREAEDDGRKRKKQKT